MKTFSYRIGGERGGSRRHEITSVELAAELRREGRLGTKMMRDYDGTRCLHGVMLDYRGQATLCRAFSIDSYMKIHALGLSTEANDNFVGTPEERCEYFAALLEAL